MRETYKRSLANEFRAADETAAERHVEPVLSARPIGDHLERVGDQNRLRTFETYEYEHLRYASSN